MIMILLLINDAVIDVVKERHSRENIDRGYHSN